MNKLLYVVNRYKYERYKENMNSNRNNFNIKKNNVYNNKSILRIKHKNSLNIEMYNHQNIDIDKNNSFLSSISHNNYKDNKKDKNLYTSYLCG